MNFSQSSKKGEDLFMFHSKIEQDFKFTQFPNIFISSFMKFSLISLYGQCVMKYVMKYLGNEEFHKVVILSNQFKTNPGCDLLGMEIL